MNRKEVFRDDLTFFKQQVPLLLPDDVKKPLAYLADSHVRDIVGIAKDMPYVFASTGKEPMRAGAALDVVKYEAELKHPERIYATNLRKYTATISQVMDLREHELHWLTKYLGHAQKLKMSHYSQTSGLVEHLDIAKIMLLQEPNNVGRFDGVDVANINFEDLDSGKEDVGTMTELTVVKDDPDMSGDDDNEFSQTGLDKDLHEERDYVAEFPHGYRMYAGNKIVVIPQATSDQPSQNKTTTALKQPTFITIDESDKDKFINDSRNINTLKKNESAVRQFQRWLSSEPRHVTVELTEIPVERLDDYIGSFLLSIRKADGSNYEPDTLTSYHRGIDRYLREQNYPFSMVNDREFSSSRAVLAAKRKELKMIGKGGRPNAAKPPTTDMQILLKEKKCIGFDTPQQLINKMWLNNTTLFGLRMGTEHHNLRWGDITLKTDADGTDYLEFKGRGNKPRTVSSQLAFKSKPYSQESLESCPIYSYKEFTRRRPDDSCTPESPFYLAINRTRRPDAEVWYKNEPLGENRVRVLMRKLTQKVSDGKTNQ
ncbi:uncharacterized protein KIAA1958-like [Mercenaria mercenaria]|uniref:uncharacterized protein KIAA1958-like n=1 Tax=Mercenaria mercenaria TaxID=6596 RepID=UPI00234F5105|nr:uncharacterized protein KIAA1958-like [Mercenaria mercenaria]